MVKRVIFGLLGSAALIAPLMGSGMAQAQSVPTFVRQSGHPQVYLNEAGTLHWIPSRSLFYALGGNWSQVAVVSRLPEAVSTPVQWIRQNGKPQVYQITQNTLHWIPSAAVFRQLGLSWDQVALVNRLPYVVGAPVSSPSSPPAQAHPSLSQQVAQKPVASLSQIQAGIQAGNPQQLGELHWNTTDAQAVVQALGSTAAPASTTALYAKTFLYAMLSDNASVFNAMPESGGASVQLSTQGIPYNVSQVDQITLNDVQHGSSSIEYDYTVTYTTTQGQAVTNTCSVTFNTFNTKQWVLGVVADLGSA